VTNATVQRTTSAFPQTKARTTSNGSRGGVLPERSKLQVGVGRSTPASDRQTRPREAAGGCRPAGPNAGDRAIGARGPVSHNARAPAAVVDAATTPRSAGTQRGEGDASCGGPRRGRFRGRGRALGTSPPACTRGRVSRRSVFVIGTSAGRRAIGRRSRSPRPRRPQRNAVGRFPRSTLAATRRTSAAVRKRRYVDEGGSRGKE